MVMKTKQMWKHRLDCKLPGEHQMTVTTVLQIFLTCLQNKEVWKKFMNNMTDGVIAHLFFYCGKNIWQETLRDF